MAKIKPFEGHSGKYGKYFERNRFVYLSGLNAIEMQLPKTGKGLEIGVGSDEKNFSYYNVLLF